MINVGVIGLGMMGSTHLDVYSKRDDVRIVAISDIIPERLSGENKARGNIEGQSQGGVDLSRAKRYDEGKKLIADPDVQLTDICLPTPIHAEYAIAALEAGQHVMVEKPVARTYADARKLVDVAAKAKGLSMSGMCMRFWPGWDWLKETIDQQTYGKVLAAHFRRVTSHPGGLFYSDGAACGGAILDLHVHDTDFVQHCFGTPDAVFSRGYSEVTNRIDHVVTHYIYDGLPLVFAEGGWCMSEGFGFQMQYTVNFEGATADFRFDGRNHVRLCQPGKEPREIEVGEGMGYEYEIAYFLDCIKQGKRPDVITLEQAAESVRIAEAEQKSIADGVAVRL